MPTVDSWYRERGTSLSTEMLWKISGIDKPKRERTLRVVFTPVAIEVNLGTPDTLAR